MSSPSDATDITALQGIQNVTSAGNQTAIETLIGWQGQGTISWGLGFLAAITVFFTLLIALRRAEADEVSKDPVRTKIIDVFLGSLAILFLIASVYSIFELLRYYRIVATLQNLWQNATNIEVPKGWQFNPILNYNGEWAMIISSLIVSIALSIYLVYLHFAGPKSPKPCFECYKDAKGKYRFRLKATNGETIADSQEYTSKEACEKGIESVKKNAPIAQIVESKE